jgi:hypothetical protein
MSMGLVADRHCIVRKLVRVSDGRVKPDHDGAGRDKKGRGSGMLSTGKNVARIRQFVCGGDWR